MSAPRGTVAIIDGDPSDLAELATLVHQSGFTAVCSSSGAEGIEAVRRHTPLLTIVDLSLPGMDGLAVIKRIREFSSTFILIVTYVDDEIDVVQSLNAGADSIMAKPLRHHEFRVRMEVAVARSQLPLQPSETAFLPTSGKASHPAPAIPVPSRRTPPDQVSASQARHLPPPPPEVTAPAQQPTPADQAPRSQAQPATVHPRPDASWLRFHGLAFSTQHRVAELDGRRLDLTSDEFTVLSSILSSGRRIRSRAELAILLSGSDDLANLDHMARDRVVQVVDSLLDKLGEEPDAPKWIETVPGVGYRRVAV